MDRERRPLEGSGEGIRTDERIRRQVLAAMAYLMRQQVREETDFFTPAQDPVGALSSSSIDKLVRIDFVQHACSAMLRASELVE